MTITASSWTGSESQRRDQGVVLPPHPQATRYRIRCSAPCFVTLPGYKVWRHFTADHVRRLEQVKRREGTRLVFAVNEFELMVEGRYVDEI